jgi:hypothetical protein
MTWSSFIVASDGAWGTCAEGENAWRLGANNGIERSLLKLGLVRLDVDPEGVVRRVDAPEGSIEPGDARRYRSILGCWPASACRFVPVAGSSWRYDFGDWWSLEQAPWGAGWRDPQWRPPTFRSPPLSYSWMMAPVTRLWFELEPGPQDFVLSVRVFDAVSERARQGVSAAVNGAPVRLLLVRNGILAGSIPPGVLKRGRNSLELSAPFSPGSNGSVAIDWVDVRPVGSS